MRALVPVLLLLPGLAACHNSCQSLCVRLAHYAENECGYTVDNAEVDACIDAMAAEGSADDRQTCRQNNDYETIALQWTCDDLEVYWNPGAGGA